VLAIQPKNPFALYGRGVARMRKGQTSEGQADITAAKTMNPKVIEIADREGFSAE
jgi:hypothetical protein